MVRALQGQNRGATSRNALIQSGNDISLLQVQQTMALEKLMIQDIAYRVEHDALVQAQKAETAKKEREIAEWGRRDKEWLDSESEKAEKAAKNKRHRIGTQRNQ